MLWVIVGESKTVKPNCYLIHPNTTRDCALFDLFFCSPGHMTLIGIGFVFNCVQTICTNINLHANMNTTGFKTYIYTYIYIYTN